jgi:PAS domain S-box-containing protein
MRGPSDLASLQQLLYQALDSADNVMLVLEQSDDDAGSPIVTATNDAFCRVSGFTQAEISDRPLVGLAASAANPATWAEIGQAAREGRSFRSELLCARKAGPPFWLGLHLMPVDEAAPPCFVLFGRDITEVLRDRQQHAAVRGLLAKVFVAVQAAVAIVDENGMIMMANPALDKLLGYQAGGLIGRNCPDITAPESRDVAQEAHQRQLENEQGYTIETAMMRADGSQARVNFTSIMAEREGLRRYRILTLSPLMVAEASPPVSVHVAGKIKLIGLDEVKSVLGPRWEALAARVMASAEHVIRTRCGPKDTWSRTPDGEFLICFGEATEEEATFRGAAIAREVRTRLIGEGVSESIAQVTAITAAVELPDQAARSPDGLVNAISERLNARLAEIETRARQTLRQAMHGATCELAAVLSRHQRGVVCHFGSLPRMLERGIQCALTALPVRESQAFDFDRLVLGAAAEQIVAQLASGSTLPIMVTVDFEVFLDRSSIERYVAACQQLDQRLRPWLILVLAHLPLGVPQSRVQECVTRLRPFCNSVAYQAEAVEMPAIVFSSLGASVVVLQEGDLNGWAPEDMAKLARLIGVVRTNRARVLVRQVSSWENAKRLLKLGVDLVALAQGAGRDEAGVGG